MKKVNVIMTLLLLIGASVIIPFLGISSIYANDQENGSQNIIDEKNLSVAVQSTTVQNHFLWQVNYKQKNPENPNSSQRLKLRLRSKGNIINAPFQEQWQLLEDGWYGEPIFSKEHQGIVHFVTEKNLKNLEIEVQQDQLEPGAEHSESSIQNVLDDVFQGPFKLVLPESDFSEPDFESNDAMLKKNRPMKFDVTTNQIKIDETGYMDHFNYIQTKEGAFPESNTSNYLNDSHSSIHDSPDVKNFNYGVSNSSEPKTLNSLRGQLDFFNGYHTYSNPFNKTDPMSTILAKKSVSPTINPNQFKVQLDVIGSASKIERPVDVVFVIDKSSSMGQNIKGEILADGPAAKDSKWQLLKTAFQSFSQGLTLSTKNIRVGLVGFGTNYYPKSGTKEIWAEEAKFGDQLYTNDYKELIGNSIFASDPDPGSKTPTYLGVDLGAKLLKDISQTNSEKYLIVLTDGEPTFYPKQTIGINDAVKNTDTDSDTIRYTLSKPDFNGNGTDIEYEKTNEYITNEVYNNDFMKAVTTYSIGYGVGNNKAINNEIIQHVLETIAGRKSRVLDANSDDELQVALEEIQRYLSGYKNNFQSGALSDPMSDYVDLVGDKSDVSVSALIINEGSPDHLNVIKEDAADYPGYAKTIKKSLQISKESSSSEIQLSKMTLGGLNGNREGIRLNYLVELKPNFRDGKFYPTNGPTWTKSENHQTYLGFAIPSIRSETFLTIPIQKVWEGDESYADLRKEVTFQLQQSIGNSSSWSDVSGKTLTIPANATGEALKGSFEKLPTVSITKDATGNLVYQPMNYRVIETARVPGYLQGVVKPTTAINSQTVNRAVTITNQLMTTDLSFTKVKEDGSNLAGAEFTLYRKNGSNLIEFQRINNPIDSQFTFKKLPIGSYVLKETISPKGFQQKEDIEFTVEDRSSGTPTIRATKGTLDDDPAKTGNQLMNQLLPFTLSVVKQDGQTKKKLSGVTFTLSEKDQSGSLSTLTTNSEGTGIFVDDKNQAIPLVTGKTYLLKETKGKPEYVKSSLLFEVLVNADGTIRISDSGKPYQEVSVTNQAIQVTVNNYQKGLLPSTGGSGKKVYYRMALSLFMLLVGISAFYFYRNRKAVHE